MNENRSHPIYDRIILFVYCICGTFAFLCCLACVVRLLFWPSYIIDLLVSILGMLLVGLPLFFRKALKGLIKRKAFKVLENIYAYGMLLYFVSFLLLSVNILTAQNNEPAPDELSEEAVIVVYGASLNGDRPGKALKKRLDRALEYLNECPQSVCIVSGGQGRGETVPEAIAMKNYLVEKGIDEERIYVEDRAKNTIDNVRFSFDVIEKEGLSKESIVSVSNAFHIPRISIIFSRLGLDGRYAFADDPEPLAMIPVLFREYMSYVNLWFFNPL